MSPSVEATTFGPLAATFGPFTESERKAKRLPPPEPPVLKFRVVPPIFQLGMVRKRGSVLIMTALLLVVAVAIAGEVFQMSRVMLEAKQLERIAEPAALGAVLELDGTRAGTGRALERARRLAGQDVTVEFSESVAGPWVADPSDPSRIQCARVTAVRKGPRPLTRRATAAQRRITEWTSGLAPFAIEGSAALTLGSLHGIGYAGDPLPREGRLAVEQGLARPFRIGDPVRLATMPGEARLALEQRIQSDTDHDSRTYEEYARVGKGNGRRMIPAIVRDAEGKSLDVAALFLPPRLEGALMGEFAGGYLQGGRFRAVAESGYVAAEAVR